jgi:hypothetical protein
MRPFFEEHVMSDRSKSEQQQRRERDEHAQRERETREREERERREEQERARATDQERLRQHPGRASGLETEPNPGLGAPGGVRPQSEPQGRGDQGRGDQGLDEHGRDERGRNDPRSVEPRAPNQGGIGVRSSGRQSPGQSNVPPHLANPGAALLSSAGAHAEGETEEGGQESLLDPASAPDSPNHPYDPGAALRTGAPLPPAEETAPTEAPSVTDVPLLMGNGVEGETLTCTMGNWVGEPTDYAYQWQRDGADFANDGETYTITAEDAGHSLTCVVTATNAIGSTTAPPSNAVAVPGGAGRTATSAAAGRR